MEAQHVRTHDVSISHHGDVGLGLSHIRKMDPSKMQEILRNARNSDEFGHRFSMEIDGERKNYTITHTGHDQYKLTPRSN